MDHSATTPVDKKVMAAMLPHFSDVYGNPSSIHSYGQTALAAVDQAREQAAKYLNCEPGEIIFTSGATESDNLAIKGLFKALRKQGLDKMHAITSAVEHDAILEPLKELAKEGVAVSYAPVKKNGVVDLDKLASLINDSTVMVSVMYVNSEVGAVMPVREIGKMINKIRERRQNEWKKRSPAERNEKPRPLYFHTDATQAVNFFDCDVKENYIDLLSLSAHKIYGPKGVGLLFRKAGVPLEGLQSGGHHEGNKRSGTLNVPGIVGLGAALTQIDEQARAKHNRSLHILRDRLVTGIMKNIPDVVLNTDREASTPAHAHFSFLGVEGESILIALDLEGIAVSTGSACASGNLKASHVLLAMGIAVEVAHNSIRFSLGKNNTASEIDTVIKKLPPIIERLRKMNPLYKK